MRGFGQFEVGDAVYYKTPGLGYAVRKSTVVEVIDNLQKFLRPRSPLFIYVLANGERLAWYKAYATREDAEASIVKELKSSLELHKVALANLQHEMAYEEAALKRLEERLTIRNSPLD